MGGTQAYVPVECANATLSPRSTEDCRRSDEPAGTVVKAIGRRVYLDHLG